MRTSSFNWAYHALLSELLQHGVFETNQRTGVGIKMLRGGHSFKVPLDQLPVAGNRRYYPRVAAAEVAWQFLGTQDPAFILKHAPKLWKKFVEDDRLLTAYGYRWREHFGRDQLQMAIDALLKDPSNRQVYISAWDPGADGLGAPNQPKNIPCPVGFSLTRTGGVLHCSVFIRSSDVFVGLPYDVMAYALTTAAVASSLGCYPGTLHVTLAHPHLYEPHFKDVERSLYNGGWDMSDPPIDMPLMSVSDIKRAPNKYVTAVKEAAKGKILNDWDPLPEVIE